MQGTMRSGPVTRDKYALRGSVEIYHAYLKHSRRSWKSQETNFAMHGSCQGKKVLEGWRASMSNTYHASL